MDAKDQEKDQNITADPQVSPQEAEEQNTQASANHEPGEQPDEQNKSKPEETESAMEQKAEQPRDTTKDSEQAGNNTEQLEQAGNTGEQLEQAESTSEQLEQTRNAVEETEQGAKPSEEAKPRDGDSVPASGGDSTSQGQESASVESPAADQEKAGEVAPVLTEEGDAQEISTKEKAKQEDEKDVDERDEKKDEEEKNEEEGEESDEMKAEGEDDVTDGEGTTTKPKEEVKKIPEDFYYNFEDFASRATVTEGSGLPEDLLTLQHSFGYDCRRRHNLQLLDEKHLLFMAGNILQIVNIHTKEQTHLRSTSGGSLGALAVHPGRKHFAVGEKGDAPNINIFEFPSLKLYRILRGGTETAYSSLNFSPDGELLASQGGDPDFMLTVWDWRQEQIMLRTKSFSQDVFCVTFASELEGQLTTAGTSHIRFWKMADTFTGLKLQGELGRFGRTEISDIEGYVELPDGKVLSGCEWGNLLLWDGGLIKVEITRRGRKSCHQGPIMQILFDEGELMTIGEDGYIRVWDFETIDTADSMDDSGLFEMEAMNELRVAADVQLYSIVKSVDDENESTIWYAQDAKGGIWRLDLSFSHTSQAPEKLMSFHAGPIVGCVTSPLTHLAASIGVDHSVRVFDYGQQKQLSEVHFNVGGSAICWAPQIVDPKGSTVVAGFEDGVVRILTVTQTTDDARRRLKMECEVALKQAFKPHSQAVTALAYDGKGQLLATGGKDSTIFFMNVGDPYEPIGFAPVPAPVLQLVWTPESYSYQGLLVVCEGGVVVEVGVPEVDKMDTSHSYKIPHLPLKHFKFRSIKSHLRHEEELERKRKEEEERKKREEEEKRKRIERGLETESEQGDEDEEKAATTVAEEWHPFIPPDPSPILHAFYDSAEEGQFWLSMGEFDAGYLYKCGFTAEEEREKTHPDLQDQPLLAVPVEESADVPVTTLTFSESGSQALLGMQDGSIRVQNLESPGSLANPGPHWTLPMHDAQQGRVRALALTCQQTQLLSVGEDGNFFLYSYMADEELKQRIAENKAKLPSARKTEEAEQVDDIDDPAAYSIEDAKQKAELDKRMKEAEEKKRDMRRQIARLRRQFKSILDQNEAMPEKQRLDRLEFEMDREIKAELENRTKERVALVRREMAWESEKQRLSLDKMRMRMKDVVECELIVLKAFLSSHELSSFRANKLSDDFYKIKAQFERKKTVEQSRDDFTRDPTKDLLAGQQRAGEVAGETTDSAEGEGSQKVETLLKGSMGERINKALSKVEEKKKKRAARRALWEDLYSSKPDDHYEDPSDVAAIQHAKENMGDYKLKTAKDYVVPDHLRMNVEKARGRLLILKDLIHEYKYEFNVRLLALRDKKIRTIEEIRQLVTELLQVQEDLNPSRRVPVPDIPEMHLEEMPEKRLEYTKETLIEYRKELLMREKASNQSGGTGFGGDFGTGAAKKTAPASQPKQMSFLSAAGASREGAASRASELELDEVEETSFSPLELELMQAEQIRLEYEQSRLLGRIQHLVTSFDVDLKLMRHEKFKVDIVMKNADLRQVTLFEELVLLKEYEKSEDVLAEKLESKRQEKLDMLNKIQEVQNRQEAKKKEIEKLQEKYTAVQQQFLTTVGDNKFADYLTKVFRKKIKRTKKKSTEGEGSGDDSDEDSDDDSDWEESDEESESEAGGYDLDICPQGCDQALYDSTTTLREKRLDCEEEIAEEKKNSDAMKKEGEGLQKKAKVIDSSLRTAQNDLEAFQLEKQQKLNELDMVTTLQFHQVQLVVNNCIPADLSPALVFPSSRVLQLQHRIAELETEKTSQKRHMRDSRRKHVQLIKDRRRFDTKISEMESHCNGMMVDKFGRVVDMEKLETVTVNRAIEELREKLMMTEAMCAEELAKYDAEISKRRGRLTEMVRNNTQRMQQLGMLVQEHKTFADSLDKRQDDLQGDDYIAVRRADVRERQRLVQLVQLQAQEIDALKDEILLLSRKGGHILPPAQPPMTHSP